MMKKIGIGLWIITMVLVGILLLAKGKSSNGEPVAQIPDRTVVPLLIDKQAFSVEVVNAPASISRGLSGRTEIGQDGMLFVMPQREIASFWMKEMLFDLDLIWIDGATIVSLTPDVPAPPPGSSLSKLPSYSSTVPVTQVLELPAGTAKGKNIRVGSTIEFVE